MGKGNVQQNLETAFQYFSEAINKDASNYLFTLKRYVDFAMAYHYRGRCY